MEEKVEGERAEVDECGEEAPVLRPRGLEYQRIRERIGVIWNKVPGSSKIRRESYRRAGTA